MCGLTNISRNSVLHDCNIRKEGGSIEIITINGICEASLFILYLKAKPLNHRPLYSGQGVSLLLSSELDQYSVISFFTRGTP
jgi:hypothetical protein